MRDVLISLAAAGAALAVATPAAAQYVPPQPYGYSYNGGDYNGYGTGDYGEVRALHARIDRIERQINQLDRYNALPRGTADRLLYQARGLEYRLNAEARNGLNSYEASDFQARIGELEQRVQYASARRYGRNGYNGYNSDNGNGYYDQNEHRRWDDDQGDEGHDHD